jgi:hypothetical protein
MSRPENENPKDRIEKTARELRKHRPRPSEALVSRVERLAERSAERRRSRPTRIQFGRRKLVYALAAALAVATVGAIVHSEFQKSSGPRPVAAMGRLDVPSGTAWGSSVGTNPDTKKLKSISPPPARLSKYSDQTIASRRSSLSAARKHSGAATTTTSQSGMLNLVNNKTAKLAPGSVADITSGGRLADLRATLLLKVENRDQLSQQTAQAMKIARSFSGYVVAARVKAPSRGVATSYLELKVPAARSQEALIKISSLGKILSQDVSLNDLKVTVTSQSKQILGLRREIASLRKSLTDPTLSTQARSQLQAKLDQAKAKLGALRVTHQQTIRRGRLATITVTFTTGDLPKIAAKPSRIHKALNRAWDGLSSEISWAAIALIVASPFLLLAALLALLVRSRRRREERRLLEQ